MRSCTMSPCGIATHVLNAPLSCAVVGNFDLGRTRGGWALSHACDAKICHSLFSTLSAGPGERRWPRLTCINYLEVIWIPTAYVVNPGAEFFHQPARVSELFRVNPNPLDIEPPPQFVCEQTAWKSLGMLLVPLDAKAHHVHIVNEIIARQV